jgi:protein-tyrosine phosphatase
MMLPLLDGAYPPDLAVFSAFIASTASQEGDIYIHCAYGHGRAALTTAALLLHRGLVTTAQEAQSMLKKARPGTHLNSAQRNCLKHYVSATSLPDPASSEDAASTTAPVTTAAEADASSEPVER